ncbi:MAG: Si-specific NAD(P)(+) transhydrogenase [Anaerolineaceae bacterium]|nr:Si-specific NAD(P)(+) transhydrogenase [Anaerolineaceae bacterium]
MAQHLYDYDMVVIGSGPAGQRAAIQAAKLEKKVAIIEKKTVLGGVCINTGTIPSKTLREAVMYLSGYTQRGLYGSSYTVKERITMDDLMFRTDAVIRSEIDVVRHQLMRNGIDLIAAEASFVDAHKLRLSYVDGRGQRDVTTSNIVIAVGTTVARDPSIQFNGQDVFTSDEVMHLDHIPKSMAVIGGGVIGCEYATIFAALGVRVTLVDKRERLLSFVDAEIIEELTHQMRNNRVTLRLGEEVSGVEMISNANGDDRVKIKLRSGKQIVTEKALYAIGRIGAVMALNLTSAGLDAAERGKIKVNEKFQTNIPHIYAVGDVIGFPSLASTSMEQGRLASCHAFGIDATSIPDLFPYGIYTIPEISIVGKTEDELTDAGIPYEVGKAQYREIARGQIIGDQAGLLKLIFHLDTHELLGVHIIGTGASELIHIGQAVLAFGGKVDYFVNTVFNYPTLAECYKTAAFDGLNRLG